ncbi:MAG: 50S ribosomal protein L29 [bacterium]|nr:50S ribosomal protein L29 [bacterium]
MKAKQLREQSEQELQKSLGDLEEQLFKLRFQKSTGQIEDPTKIRQVRKNIARVLTVLTERRVEGSAR